MRTEFCTRRQRVVSFWGTAEGRSWNQCDTPNPLLPPDPPDTLSDLGTARQEIGGPTVDCRDKEWNGAIDECVRKYNGTENHRKCDSEVKDRNELYVRI
jgi:hypothetical protein